jgi:DNA-binding beta-propeller fold protein YncE
MRRRVSDLPKHRIIAAATIALSLGLIAGLVSFAGGATLARVAPRIAAAQAAPGAQLISIQPEPAEECEWEPASARVSANLPLRAAALAEFRASEADDAASSAASLSQRKPVRMIRDPYSSYSAVAVDATNNEVVLTDENLFNILVYDRTANTPPSATMTEPKRMIGGLKTKIEFQCGLYIDPTNGDIFAVNNDTVDTLVIFSRQARGNESPTRQLSTPHGTFGVAVDEKAQELYLTVQHDSAVVVFPKLAQNDDAPIRLLQGNHTRLADPHGIALDEKNNLIYVTNHGSVHDQGAKGEPPTGKVLGRRQGKKYWPVSLDDSIPGSGRMQPPTITVYSKTASGDTPPVRVIEGPKTQMDWPTGIAVNQENGEVYVANDGGNSILVFSPAASGDVAPIRVIQGPKSMVKNPTGVYLDAKNHEVWSANFGNHTATVYKMDASGDAVPLRVIRSAPADRPVPGMGNPHPIAYDDKREQILVPN